MLDILKLNLLSGATTIPVSTSVKCEQHPVSLSVKEIIFLFYLKLSKQFEFCFVMILFECSGNWQPELFLEFQVTAESNQKALWFGSLLF